MFKGLSDPVGLFSYKSAVKHGLSILYELFKQVLSKPALVGRPAKVSSISLVSWLNVLVNDY
jgi:hypothetical protein